MDQAINADAVDSQEASTHAEALEQLVDSYLCWRRARKPADMEVSHLQDYLSTILPEFSADCPDHLHFVEALCQVLDKEGPAAPQQEDRQTPFRLQAFECLEPIGSGGFGTIYLAHDHQLDRAVAVKLLHPWISSRDCQRIFHEAQAAACLRHPGIVTVHGIVEADGEQGIVYDYIDGLTLREWMRRHPLSPRQAAEILLQVAEALAYAHGEGLIHRDLKPANIIVDLRSVERAEDEDGGTKPKQATANLRVLLLDFGLALRLDGSAQPPGCAGTPAYMSPEPGAGNPADERSDVYALGLILHEMLAGKLPEPAPTGRPAERRVRLGPAVPLDLRAICGKALEHEPARRFQSAGELAAELRRWLHGEPIRSRSVGVVERVRLWARRKPMEAALTTAVLVITLAGFALVTWKWLETQASFEEIERTTARLTASLNEQAMLATSLNEATSDKHAMVSLNLGQLANALRLQEASRRTFEELARMKPNVDEYQDGLAISLNSIGVFHYAARKDDPGKLDDALGAFTKAQNIWESLICKNGASGTLQNNLARSFSNIGNILGDQGKKREALEHHQKAVAIREQLVKLESDNLRYRLDLATACNNLGIQLQLSDNLPEALRAFRRAVDLRQQVLKEDDTDHVCRFALAVSLDSVAVWHVINRQPDEALRAFRQERSLCERLVVDFPLVPAYHSRLEQTYLTIGRVLVEEAQLAAAADELKMIVTKDRNRLYQLARTYALGPSKVGGGKPFNQLNPDEQALHRQFADSAMKMLEKAVANGFDDVKRIQSSEDLEPLREREDFKTLVAELKRKVNADREQK